MTTTEERGAKIALYTINDTDYEDWSKWADTYLDSFPIEEQRPLESIIRLIGKQKRYRANAILHDGQCIGLLTSWHFDTFVYIEHFAIAAGLRSSGYGGMALRYFMESQSLPVVLEAEPPADSISIRRVRFYERNGFTLYSYDYHQPPYAPDRQGIPLRLMGTVPEDAARPDRIARTLYREVYGVEL